MFIWFWPNSSFASYLDVLFPGHEITFAKKIVGTLFVLKTYFPFKLLAARNRAKNFAILIYSSTCMHTFFLHVLIIH